MKNQNKMIFKNHILYTFKNYFLIIFLAIVISINFVSVYFHLSKEFFFKYSWLSNLIYFISSIFYIFIINFYVFIYCKVSGFDAIHDSIVGNKIKIYVWKNIVILCLYSICAGFLTIFYSLLQSIVFKKVGVFFLNLILNLFVSLLIIFVLQSFFTILLFITKKLILLAILFIFTLLIFSIEPIAQKMNNHQYSANTKNLLKVINKEKNKMLFLNKDYKTNYLEEKSNSDLISNIFHIKNLSNIHKLNFNNHFRLVNHNLNKFNNYTIKYFPIKSNIRNEDSVFVYHIEDRPITSESNEKISNFLRDKAFLNYEKSNDIKELIIELKKPIWTFKNVNNLSFIKKIIGQDENEFQYIFRDWSQIATNNYEFKRMIIDKTSKDFWNLLDIVYSNKYNINLLNNNSIYYVENRVPQNNFIDEDYSIVNKDIEFLLNNLIKIDDKSKTIFILNNDGAYSSVSFELFNKIIPNVSNSKEWKKLISKNLIYKNAKRLLNKLSKFESYSIIPFKYDLKDNQSIQYFTSELIDFQIKPNNCNSIYFWAILLIPGCLYIYPCWFIFKNIKKSKKMINLVWNKPGQKN